MKEKVIWKNSQYEIIERKPNIFNLTPTNLRKCGVHEMLRWLVQYLFGYRVYILKDVCGGGIEVGYCFIGDGANIRYPFAKRGDAVVGPYYIEEKKRGQGLGIMLVSVCLQLSPPKSGKAWDFIQHDNAASIKTSEAVGFCYYSDCKYSKYLRILDTCRTEKGDEMLFCRLDKGDNN